MKKIIPHIAQLGVLLSLFTILWTTVSCTILERKKPVVVNIIKKEATPVNDVPENKMKHLKQMSLQERHHQQIEKFVSRLVDFCNVQHQLGRLENKMNRLMDEGNFKKADDILGEHSRISTGHLHFWTCYHAQIKNKKIKKTKNYRLL